MVMISWNEVLTSFMRSNSLSFSKNLKKFVIDESAQFCGAPLRVHEAG
jgi:hypothetical protein